MSHRCLLRHRGAERVFLNADHIAGSLPLTASLIHRLALRRIPEYRLWGENVRKVPVE